MPIRSDMNFYEMTCSSCGKKWYMSLYQWNEYTYKIKIDGKFITLCGWNCYRKEQRRYELGEFSNKQDRRKQKQAN